MRVIETEKELLPIMQEMYKARNNTWHESKYLKGYYFWNHEKKEFGTDFTVLYAKLNLLKKVAKLIWQN